jgi:formate dehydrogenase major subunit
MNLMEMMDRAAEGRLKALWAIGYDILLTNPNSEMTRRALASVELLIVQDMFLNETAREFATVFLPVASSFEKEGTFMNAERRIQMVRKALDPPGEARTDWRIVCDVARAMGKGEFFDFGSPEEIWNEVRKVWKAGQGISYARMEQNGVQWPCSAEDHPGTEVLHTETFAGNPRAALRRVQFIPTPEAASTEFPFLLTSGRTLYQFNAGTMTLRTDNTALHPADFLDIAPDDAARLAIEDGERVRIRSRYGETVLPLRIHPGVKPGELFATFHTAAVFLNRVTGPHRDRDTLTPEYKVTAVRIERA